MNEKENVDFRKKTKKYLGIFIFLAIFAIFIFFILNAFSYFDPMNFCYVNISEKYLNNDKDTIIKAIKKIKEEDKKSYKDFCHYVNEIIEDRCFAGDPNFSQSLLNREIAGCYIKGSRTIYLNPDKTGVEEKSHLIKRYSQKSKEFWQSFLKE